MQNIIETYKNSLGRRAGSLLPLPVPLPACPAILPEGPGFLF
jgi:hypothetical protein